MLREFSPNENVCVDVFLRDGQKFFGCDVCANGNAPEGFYAFWLHDELVIYQLDLIEHIAYYNKED